MRIETKRAAASLKAIVVGAVWLGLLATGFAALLAYSFAPGKIGSPPPWKAISHDLPLADPQAEFQLLMAVHPRCPCTHASIGELERIIARCQGRLASTLLVYEPIGADEDWSDTRLARVAKALPYATLVRDLDGEVAKRLGMKTSGSVVLYDGRREAVYYGGITSSRNHHGDNAGAAAVVSLVRRGAAELRCAPVFGCSIERPSTNDASDLCGEDRCVIK